MTDVAPAPSHPVAMAPDPRLAERLATLEAACLSLGTPAQGAAKVLEAMNGVQAAARGVVGALDDLEMAWGDVPDALRRHVAPALERCLGAATLRMATLVLGEKQYAAESDDGSSWQAWLSDRAYPIRRAYQELLALAGRALRAGEDEDNAALLGQVTAAFDHYEPLEGAEYSGGAMVPMWWRHSAILQLPCLALLSDLAVSGCLGHALETATDETGVARLLVDKGGRARLRERFVRRLIVWADGTLDHAAPSAEVKAGKTKEEKKELEHERRALERAMELCDCADRVLALRLLADVPSEEVDRKLAACLARAAGGLGFVKTRRPGQKLAEPPGTRSLALDALVRRLRDARDRALASGADVPAIVTAIAAAVPFHPSTAKALETPDAAGLRAYFDDFLDDPDALGAGGARVGHADDAFWFVFEAFIEPGSVVPAGTPVPPAWYRLMATAPEVNLSAWFLDRAPAWHARRQIHVALARPEADTAALQAEYRKVALSSGWGPDTPTKAERDVANLYAAAFREAFFLPLDALTRHASAATRLAAQRLLAAAREPRMLPLLIRGLADTDERVRATAGEAVKRLLPDDPKDGEKTIDWCELPSENYDGAGRGRWSQPIGALLSTNVAVKPDWKAPSVPHLSAQAGFALETLRAALLHAISEPFAPATTARFTAQTAALRAIKRIGLPLRGLPERQALLFGLRHPDPELHDWVASTLGPVGPKVFDTSICRPPFTHKAPTTGYTAFPDLKKLPGSGADEKDAAVPTEARPFAALWLDEAFRRDVQDALTLRLLSWGGDRPAYKDRFEPKQLDRTVWLDLLLLVELAGPNALETYKELVRDPAQPESLRAYAVRYVADFAPPTVTWETVRVVLEAASGLPRAPGELEGEVLYFLIQEGDRQEGKVERAEVREALDAMNKFVGPAKQWLTDEAQDMPQYGVIRRFEVLAKLTSPAEKVRATTRMLTPEGDGADLSELLECTVGGEKKELTFGAALRLVGAEGGPPESVRAREATDWLLGCSVGGGLTDSEVDWLLGRVVPASGARTAAHVTAKEAAELLYDWLRPSRFVPDEVPHLARALARLLARAWYHDREGAYKQLEALLTPAGDAAKSNDGRRDRERVARVLARLALDPLPALTNAAWSVVDEAHLRRAAADLLDPLVMTPGLLGSDGADRGKESAALFFATSALGRIYRDETTARQEAFAERLRKTWQDALERAAAPRLARLAGSERVAGRLAAVAMRSGADALVDEAVAFRSAQVWLLRQLFDEASLDALGAALRSDWYSAHHVLKSGLDRGWVKLSAAEAEKFAGKYQYVINRIARYRTTGGAFFEQVAGVFSSRDAQAALLELPVTAAGPRRACVEDLCQLFDDAAAFEETCQALDGAERTLGTRFGAAPARRAWRGLTTEVAAALAQDRGAGHPLFAALAAGAIHRRKRTRPAPSGPSLQDVLAVVEAGVDFHVAVARLGISAVGLNSIVFASAVKVQVGLTRLMATVFRTERVIKGLPSKTGIKGLLSERGKVYRRNLTELEGSADSLKKSSSTVLGAIDSGVAFIELYDKYCDENASQLDKDLQATKASATFLKFVLDSGLNKDLLDEGTKAKKVGKGASKTLGVITAAISAQQQLAEMDKLVERCGSPDVPSWQVMPDDVNKEMMKRTVECFGHLCNCCEVLPGGPGKVIGVIGDMCIYGVQAVELYDSIFGANEHEKAAAYLDYDWLYWWEST